MAVSVNRETLKRVKVPASACRSPEAAAYCPLYLQQGVQTVQRVMSNTPWSLHDL